jgi:hypothetical protein
MPLSFDNVATLKGNITARSKFVVGSDIDLVITCGGAWSTEGNDRTSLKLDQDSEIQQLVTDLTGQAPVVVLTTAPGAIVTASFEGTVAVMFGRYTFRS